MTPSGADAWLVDERWFKAYPLADATTTIGRGPESTIILRDPAVSRHHADVKKESAGYMLHAFGSSGVKLNGLRVSTELALQEGDVVEIAFTTLRFTTKAPTNEMFILPRDTPTILDQMLEGPTRATIAAINRSLLVTSSRRYWHVIAIVVLILALLAFVLATLTPG